VTWLRVTWRRLAVAAVAAGAATTAGGYVVEASGRGPDPLGPGEVVVAIDIEHSRFSPDRIVVRPGTIVRFVVTNHDPILHELIVGDDEVHRRHATGTHAEHPPVPGEVSVGPGRTASTIMRFDEAGRAVAFACHLPGHVAYGMVGEVVVTG
jgi:uncharacterized cupredoxin-like copper-binding protein